MHLNEREQILIWGTEAHNFSVERQRVTVRSFCGFFFDKNSMLQSKDKMFAFPPHVAESLRGRL